MTSAHFHTYRGSPESPFPPMSGAWAIVGWADDVARNRALELSTVLPLWSYRDELTSSGLYRYFHAQWGDGQCGVCAVKMQGGGAATLGASDPTLDPSGSANAGSQDAQGSSGGASSDGSSFEGSTSTTTATTDTSSGLQEGNSAPVDISPPQGGGGGGTPPAPKPSPAAPSSVGSSSSSGGIVAGVIAALAVTATIVAAAAAKHPVRH